MQTLRKKSSPCKYRNDRFFGDGVTFKAKLIGILEVGEARGDRMCQEALQDLKMAIRAAGEHKQRITIHVTIDGLRLRDEKTGDSLYHHPVHKISFIAQDMTDSRAFGYIFGSPDSGHRFFGIKTDKAASQVVLAMRDLFQVVFELKKKEIELARQQIQSKSLHDPSSLLLSIKNAIDNDHSASTSLNITTNNMIKNEGAKSKEQNLMSPESVQDLVDLEQELSSIQRGITQMERITPNEPTPPIAKIGFPDEDPFGDTHFATFNILPPPPESARSRHSKQSNKTTTDSIVTTSLISTGISTATNTTANLSSLLTSQFNTTNTPNLNSDLTTENWLNELEKSEVFVEPNVTQKATEIITPATTVATQIIANIAESPVNIQQPIKSDVFTDLDPLGTGKNKPYVDKKYFFHDIKNPPKKILKDFSSSGGSQENQSTFSSSFGCRNDSFDIDNVFNDSYDSQQHSSILEINEKTKNSSNVETDQDENNSATAPRDTDPFSPTRKKSDPFQDGDIFSKLDPFEFDFKKNLSNSKVDSEEPIKINTNSSVGTRGSPSVFNGPLQVSLPPEWGASPDQSYSNRSHINRQTSESPNSRLNRPSVFKQNTVDVISSISTKKMPHLFGQKFTKRDSNSINMRRLQESDSLSENETAPEPPPRPDFSSYIEPPPLPPKKQFSDIIIRPRITSSSAIPPLQRYDYVSAKIKLSSLSQDSGNIAPPIPLPSRRIGRTDSTFPGPGRPRKPGCDDDDYLAPLRNEASEVPLPLLPPPHQIGKNRIRRNESTSVLESSKESAQSLEQNIIPDITLSQLLTLGIDDLAKKLNVPISKLNTMTLVELTKYLSEFIEKSKKPITRTATIETKQQADTAIFKVNFDQNSDATFIAKFDDNFGEDDGGMNFIANFSSDIKPEPHVLATVGILRNVDQEKQQSQMTPQSIVPSADRYAVFREIIDQELKNDSSVEIKSSPEDEDDENGFNVTLQQSSKKDMDGVFSDEDEEKSSEVSTVQTTKIDTKITEAIANAKDRYAALRDIILHEDLFEEPHQQLFGSFGQEDSDFLQGESNISEDIYNTENILTEKILDKGATVDSFRDSSPDSNKNFEIESEEVKDELSKHHDVKNNTGIATTINTLTVSGNKDDLEINELMNRAISNLSLDSRLSPAANAKSTINLESLSPTPEQQQILQRKSPLNNKKSIQAQQFNDVSTSPIPIQKSPAPPLQIQSSLMIKSPKSPSNKTSPMVSSLIETESRSNKLLDKSGSISDMICGSSPDTVGIKQLDQKWAVFDTKPTEKKSSLKSSNRIEKEGESPISSVEGGVGGSKEEWKNLPNAKINNTKIVDPDFNNRRWPGQTSSSSRDLSPWDDENTDYKKHLPLNENNADRRGYYMRHSRRMNSCDEDYDYEDEMLKRRERKIKSGMSRSRENFEFEQSSSWYQTGGMHHSWSPQDEHDERSRTFDRGMYERNSYGPPVYEKRKLPLNYDRRDYKTGYDKRKFYNRSGGGDYCRPDYDSPPESKDQRLKYGRRSDYENIYCDDNYNGGRNNIIYKSREYYGERRSFDRESMDSYESGSGGGRRRKSFGSGDVYGSFDSRDEFRDRCYLNDKTSRSLRKSLKGRIVPSGSIVGDEYEQDSENDGQIRSREHCRSLQRPSSGSRIRKSSGSSPWDGEEPGSFQGQKGGWKRPSSASESERRLQAERRAAAALNTLSGSDGEKDRRTRKKQRPRGKEGTNLPPPSGRSYRDNYDYVYDDYDQQLPSSQVPQDEDKFERLNRRRYDVNQRILEAERRKRSTSGDKFNYEDDDDDAYHKYQMSNKKEQFYDKERYNRSISSGGTPKCLDLFEESATSSMMKKSSIRQQNEFPTDFEDYENTPQSTASNNKFSFEVGFESDFNSSPPLPLQSASGIIPSCVKSNYRFSNDFSEKQQSQPAIKNNTSLTTEQEYPTPTQKLRFDDNVIISKFDNNEHNNMTSAFEDDFSKAKFDDNFLDNEWSEQQQQQPQQQQQQQPKKNNIKLNKRQQQDHIRKSESVNIFAKKVDDPFEDDEFFQNSIINNKTNGNKNNSNNLQQNNNNIITKNSKEIKNNQWDNNFAKFDENM